MPAPFAVPGGRLGPEVFAGQQITVAGWGITGRSCARVLTDLGARVTVLNAAPIDAGDAAAATIIDADPAALAAACAHLRHSLLIASPGWPPHHPVLAGWRGPIWSDLELAWHIADPATRWLTLTGTNGKTTTAGMAGAILRAAGRRHRVVGNIGVPIVQALWDTRLDPPENLVVELSSFQLHYVHSISAVAAAVLNLASDHLDWHGSYEQYVAAKARIYDRTQAACVYNEDDPATRRLVEEADVVEGARAVGFTLAAPRVGQVGFVEGALVDRAYAPDRRTHGQVLAEVGDLAHLAGPSGLAPHMVANALAAAALTRADGVDPADVAAGLAAFHTEAHRLQPVATIDGVHYVNDSKATNAHAAAASLQGMGRGTVVWIAGGLAKGARFEDLVAARASRLRGAVIIGVDQEPFLAAISRHAPQVPIEIVNPGEDEIMGSAVRAAHRLARAGDTVLLAPAGASMDQFHSYEARGEAFMAAVHDFARTARTAEGPEPVRAEDEA